MTKIKVMLVSVSVDSASVNMIPATVIAANGEVTRPAAEQDAKPALTATFRAIDGRQMDFTLPVPSGAGLTPGEKYDVEFTKSTDKS